MSSISRDVSRERSMSPKHKNSLSDLGKLSIPMWDSSDPDRAPPPLPLNPQHPNTSTTKANTSENVAAAARALAERARQSAGPSHYTTNSMQNRSPEKSPTRTPQHKRLQSLQNGNLKDFKASLENNRPSDWYSARPSTPIAKNDSLPSSPEQNRSRSGSPAAADMKKAPGDSAKERTSSRPGPRPILGENTPPSATMLAIQNMPRCDSDTPMLGSITNSSNPRSPQAGDSISAQMRHLTDIATTLQKEMAALSRRSKDNATDLVSLKEATKTRDEDIRRSLRELVTNARASDLGSLAPPRGDMSRSTSAMDFVPRSVEPRPFYSPQFLKSSSMPKMRGVESLGDLDRASSPAPYSVEGAASIAMLEKILREMSTKEGQERLVSMLSELVEKSSKDNSEVTKKVEALVEIIKEKQTSKALVKHSNARSQSENLDSHGVNSLDNSRIDNRSLGSPQTVNIVSDELRQALQKIKDSVAQGGGLTGEIKSLVRELRGEVLGMGRELGHKLEKATAQPQNERAMVGTEDRSKRGEIGRIVQEGMAELKEHMDQLMETKRRRSTGSTRSVDSGEVYALVKQSLAEQSVERANGRAMQYQQFDQEAIIQAVKEAYEAYKPEIELQQFGLERDEILQCLKEGLEDYQSTRSSQNTVSRDDVVEAVQEALHHFKPPTPVTEATEIKEEVLFAVRECLQEFQMSRHWKSERRSGDISREDVLSAVKEGLGNFRKEGAREIEINRDDLFHAVKAGLDNTQTPFGGYGDEVLKSLHDIVEGMRVEFKEYSAASGRDTELVLDTTKDGLESLRVAIQSYVDRCRDVTGKDEIVGTLKNGLQDLQNTVTSFVTHASRNDNVSFRKDMADFIKCQFEELHEAIAKQDRGVDTAETHEQLLQALTGGLGNLKSTISNSMEAPNTAVLGEIKEEFERLRETLINVSATHRDELLEEVREHISNSNNPVSSRQADSHEQLIDNIRDEIGTIRDTFSAPVLHSGQREGHSDDALAALQESIDSLRVQLSADHGERSDESLVLIKEEFGHIREVLGNSLISHSSSAEKTELLEAIRDGLEALRCDNGRADNDTIRSEGLDVVRGELEQIRESIATTMLQSHNATDVDAIVTAIRTGFDELQTQVGTNLGSGDRTIVGSEEILNGFQESIMELRGEISRMADKPVDIDMTVSYDILDTLKDGLAGLRRDIEGVKSSAHGVANSDIVLSDGAPSKDDFDRLESMLKRLQIKVEAVDENVRANAQANQDAQSFKSVDSTTREALNGIETMLYELRRTVDELVAQNGDRVSKEDTDALETLLQNTKAKIDEDVLPMLDSTVTKEQVDAVEALVQLTSESVDTLAARMEADWASKDDIAAVYQLLQDADSSIKAFKDDFNVESSEKPSKDDLDAIGNVCDEIKDKIDGLPQFEFVSTKEDQDRLLALVENFKESHEQFKHQYESDLEVTAKAFDDRKEESEKLVEQIDELKGLITESKDDIKSRLKRGNEDVRALDEILQGIEDKIDEAPNAISNVQEVWEVVTQEFERSHTTLDSIQAGLDDNSAKLQDGDEAILAFLNEDLGIKLDDRFLEVLARHDEQQQAMEHAAQLIADNGARQDDLLNESRAMADDLKVTIDTLGESITAINPTLREATDKMGDDAKTVFNKVEELSARINASHIDAMSETQLVRQDVSKSLSTVTDLKDAVANFQPQAMTTLKNLLALVGEHFEHSKQSLRTPHDKMDKSSIEETIRNSFAALPAPTVDLAPSSVADFDDSKLHSKLDKLLFLGKYDDSALQDKLDDVVRRMMTSERTLAELDKIDGIHRQLQTTAAEVSGFLNRQNEIVAQENESVKKEAVEAAEDLTRCRNDKDDLELKVQNLTATRESLAADVESLMADRDDLQSQKSRLAAEVSSLETALKIRREELHEMDSRADILERRIIDGVMDHSRALLMAKQPKASGGMNLKRVASNTSNITTSTTTPSSVASAGVNMALSRKRSNKKSVAVADPASRRILSLSQITGNAASKSTNVSASLSASRPALGSFNSLKRSQSVKNPTVHKASWAGRNSITELDKENESIVEDSDEDRETEALYSRSATSLLQRSISRSASQMSASERRTSLGTRSSEYSYATGSYLTGSDSMRTASYGSTVRSVVGGGSSFEESSRGESGEEEVGDGVEENEAGDLNEAHSAEASNEVMNTIHGLDLILPEEGQKDLIIRPPNGYDSGLGSDLPTALAMSQNGSDYFAPVSKG